MMNMTTCMSFSQAKAARRMDTPCCAITRIVRMDDGALAAVRGAGAADVSLLRWCTVWAAWLPRSTFNEPLKVL